MTLITADQIKHSDISHADNMCTATDMHRHRCVFIRCIGMHLSFNLLNVYTKFVWLTSKRLTFSDSMTDRKTKRNCVSVTITAVEYRQQAKQPPCYTIKSIV